MDTLAQTRYLKQLYFFMFVGSGFVAPFATLFYKHTLTHPDGTTADNLIGWIYFFMPLVGIAANIPAGILADKLHIGRHLITVFCFGTAVFTFLTGLGGSSWAFDLDLWQRFAWIFTMVMLYNAFLMPIIPTVDAETMNLLNRTGHREAYGTLRVYGTAGWSVSCIAMGILLTYLYHYSVVFYATAGAFFLLGILSLRGIKTRKNLAKIKIPWDHLRKDRKFKWFMVFSLLNGILFSASFLYTSYFFDDVLKTPWEMGLVFGTWTLFEIPIMFFSRPLLSKFGNHWLIIWGLLLNGIRLILFSLFELETPFFYKWAAATLQGAAFGLIHIGTIDFVDRQSHRDMRTTYMNIASVVRITMASAIGGKLGAGIISAFGAETLMALCGVGSIALMFFFALVIKGHSTDTDNSSTKTN